MPKSVSIGTITIEKPMEVTKHYECAAWYRNIRTDPGTSELTLTFTPEYWPQWVLFGLQGTITGSCFDSLFGGNVISANRNRDVGERVEYCWQWSAFHLAEQTIGKLDLKPEWAWLLEPYETWSPRVEAMRNAARR